MMKRQNSSRWVIRKLEDRIVHMISGSGIDSNKPSSFEDSKMDPSNLPESLYTRFIDKSTDQKPSVSSDAMDLLKQAEEEGEKIIAHAQSASLQRIEGQKQERTESEHNEVLPVENAKKVAEFTKTESIVQNSEKNKINAKEKKVLIHPVTRPVQNPISSEIANFLKAFDEIEESSDPLDEMREEEEKKESEFEVLLTKRKERILREVEEEDLHRFKLLQPPEQDEYRGRGEILEVPKREELESNFAFVLLELNKQGFTQKRLKDLLHREDSKIELRNLIRKILYPKLYGRGYYKLINQQFIYDQLISRLSPKGNDSEKQVGEEKSNS